MWPEFKAGPANRRGGNCVNCWTSEKRQPLCLAWAFAQLVNEKVSWVLNNMKQYQFNPIRIYAEQRIWTLLLDAHR